jgi:hypothetical protein
MSIAGNFVRGLLIHRGSVLGGQLASNSGVECGPCTEYQLRASRFATPIVAVEICRKGRDALTCAQRTRIVMVQFGHSKNVPDAGFLPQQGPWDDFSRGFGLLGRAAIGHGLRQPA